MIRSTFSGFTTAQMAMSASQRALDVTGQNLSNVNTRGYTRQRLDLSSIGPVGAGYGASPFDCRVGQGVQMDRISQIRDPFLDKQYRTQIVKVGTADAKDQILSELGNIFDETDMKAIRANFNDLISQLERMANPSSSGQAGTDATVRSAAEVLINAIHQNASSMETVKKGIVDKMETSTIANLNACVKKIAELNKSIKNSQILGNPALELQDERNNAIDDLATYLPISVKYTGKPVGGGVTIEELQISFTAGDKEYSLVSGDKSSEFKLDTTGGIPLKLSLKDANGLEDEDISTKITDGVLKGNFDMLNKSGIFDGTDVNGIGYYEKFFDAFVDKFATMMNDMNATVDADGKRVPHDLFVKSDTNDKFTAANIKVSEGWMNGTTTLTRTKGEGSSAYDNIQKMINVLGSEKIQLKYKEGTPDKKDIFKGTFIECYDNLQNTQAIERKASSSILSNNMTVLNQIADSKDSVSGVYLDEEVMDLMRYQQSYNAAARMMTTLDEALNTLISNTGVVGR